MRILLFVFIITVTGCSFRADRASHSALREVFFENSSRSVSNLTQFNAKVLVINFWASWCPSCMMEMRSLDSMSKRFGSQDLEVLAIMLDDKPSNLIKVEKALRPHLKLYIDSYDRAKKHFKVQNLPSTYFISCDGELLRIQDPLYERSASVLVGPREWNTEAMYQSLSELINRSDC